MRTWKIVLFTVVLVFAVGTIAYALNTSTSADSDSQVSISSVYGQEIQLGSGCCPKKDSGTDDKKEDSPKGCPKKSEKGCPKKGSGCDKK